MCVYPLEVAFSPKRGDRKKFRYYKNTRRGSKKARRDNSHYARDSKWAT